MRLDVSNSTRTCVYLRQTAAAWHVASGLCVRVCHMNKIIECGTGARHLLQQPTWIMVTTVALVWLLYVLFDPDHQRYEAEG